MGFFSNIAGLGTDMILLVTAISIGYIIFATFLSRWLVNARKQRQIQARMKQISKEMNELVKNKGSAQEIAAKQKEMMPLISQSFGASLKPMIILLPLTMGIYWFLVPALSSSVTQRGIIQGLFFVVLVLGGLVAAVITYYWDKMQTKKEISVQVVSRPVQSNPEAKVI